jgi:hypothetical protein
MGPNVYVLQQIHVDVISFIGYTHAIIYIHAVAMVCSVVYYLKA